MQPPTGGMGGGRGPGGWGGGPPGDPSVWQEASFKRLDTDGDGKISRAEWTSNPRLKDRNFDEADLNKDGFVALDEYKAGMNAMMAKGGFGGDRGRRGPGGNSPTPGAPEAAPQPVVVPGAPPQPGAPAPEAPRRKAEIPDEPKPVVNRFGHMPKELPEWFGTLDGDRDGMVALYEWRRDKKHTIAEFAAMDLNGDGYLTAEEWMRAEKLKLDKPGATVVAAKPSTRRNGKPVPAEKGDKADTAKPERARGQRASTDAPPSGKNPFMQ